MDIDAETIDNQDFVIGHPRREVSITDYFTRNAKINNF